MDKTILTTKPCEELFQMMCEAFKKALEDQQKKEQRQAEPEKLRTIKQTAAFFGVSVVTIYNWRNEGRLPFVRVGRRVYFKHSDIMALLKSVNLKKQQP